MARPGANVTGFTNVVESMSGKWVELLKILSPEIAHITMLYSPKTSPGRGGTYFLESFEAAGRIVGVQTRTVGVEGSQELEQAIETAGSFGRSALILAPSTSISTQAHLVVSLAARHRLPAVYPFTYFTDQGGLISYGTDTSDLFRRAASYVDRILKGAKPEDLPVQAPTKFLLTINRRAAAAIGVSIPQHLLARADQIID
jgi:putative ABC transport system substrate-binding protein